MISLFAGEERSAKRDRLGDPLQVLDRHIDFAALAKAVDAKLENPGHPNFAVGILDTQTLRAGSGTCTSPGIASLGCHVSK